MRHSEKVKMIIISNNKQIKGLFIALIKIIINFKQLIKSIGTIYYKN